MIREVPLSGRFPPSCGAQKALRLTVRRNLHQVFSIPWEGFSVLLLGSGVGITGHLRPRKKKLPLSRGPSTKEIPMATS